MKTRKIHHDPATRCAESAVLADRYRRVRQIPGALGQVGRLLPATTRRKTEQLPPPRTVLPLQALPAVDELLVLGAAVRTGRNPIRMTAAIWRQGRNHATSQ